MSSDLTPRRAAQVLVYSWLSYVGPAPWALDAAAMTEVLKDYNYRVTETRHALILEQVDRLVTPWRSALADKIQAFADV